MFPNSAKRRPCVHKISKVVDYSKIRNVFKRDRCPLEIGSVSAFSELAFSFMHEKETTRSWLLPLLLLLLLYCILKFILFYSYTNFLCCLGEVHMRCFDTFDSWDSKWGAKFNHFYVSILYTGKVGTNT